MSSTGSSILGGPSLYMDSNLGAFKDKLSVDQLRLNDLKVLLKNIYKSF